MAERKGFEPSIRLWRIYTFQAYSFDHSDTSLYAVSECQSNKIFFYLTSFFLIFY